MWIPLPRRIWETIGISRNNFRDIAIDRRQKFGFGVFSVDFRLGKDFRGTKD